METKEKDNLTINIARQHLVTANDNVLPMLRGPLDADDSRALLKPKTNALILVPTGLGLIERHPELLGAGFDPGFVKRVQERLGAMRSLTQEAAAFAKHLSDSLRQDEVFLYRAVMTAYAVGKQAGGSSDIQCFVEEMQKALSIGPRVTRTVTGSIETRDSIG